MVVDIHDRKVHPMGNFRPTDDERRRMTRLTEVLREMGTLPANTDPDTDPRYIRLNNEAATLERGLPKMLAFRAREASF